MNVKQNEIKLNMFEYFLKCLRSYFDFKGRACRKEFWSFMFFDVMIIVWLVIMLSLFIDMMNLCREPLESLTTLFTFFIKLPLLIPLISVAVRRLHDLNKSGLYIIPLCICMAIEIIYFFPIEFIKDYYTHIGIFNSIVYAYFIIFIFIRKGNEGMNRYGENSECGNRNSEAHG